MCGQSASYLSGPILWFLVETYKGAGCARPGKKPVGSDFRRRADGRLGREFPATFAYGGNLPFLLPSDGQGAGGMRQLAFAFHAVFLSALFPGQLAAVVDEEA